MTIYPFLNVQLNDKYFQSVLQPPSQEYYVFLSHQGDTILPTSNHFWQPPIHFWIHEFPNFQYSPFIWISKFYINEVYGLLCLSSFTKHVFCGGTYQCLTPPPFFYRWAIPNSACILGITHFCLDGNVTCLYSLAIINRAVVQILCICYVSWFFFCSFFSLMGESVKIATPQTLL